MQATFWTFRQMKIFFMAVFCGAVLIYASDSIVIFLEMRRFPEKNFSEIQQMILRGNFPHCDGRIEDTLTRERVDKCLLRSIPKMTNVTHEGPPESHQMTVEGECSDGDTFFARYLIEVSRSDSVIWCKLSTGLTRADLAAQPLTPFTIPPKEIPLLTKFLLAISGHGEG